MPAGTRDRARRVLVVGSGGREHALCRALAAHPGLEALYCAPGNPGISRLARCVPIQAEDVAQLVAFAQTERIDLTVVGPERPLALGLVDALTASGASAFGPTQAAARIETSKAFAKEIMTRAGVRTAKAAVFADLAAARAYITTHGPPLVIKADGLAGGKGVIMARSTPEALEAVEMLMGRRALGEAGQTVVIEALLVGEEVTVMALTDGRTVLPLEPAQDAKRLLDDDQGPNTGGMGAYSPVPWLSSAQRDVILREILYPVVTALGEAGTPYRGVLYAGLMIVEGRPYVLEFNARFGDPEAQAVLPRLQTDLLELCEAVVDGRLGDCSVRWRAEAAVCVVMASKGYPATVESGRVVRGLREAEEAAETFVFHAGTAERPGTGPAPQAGEPPQAREIVTAGGRILGVTALGPDLAAARARAYHGVERIRFEGMQYRRDIAGLAQPRPSPTPGPLTPPLSLQGRGESRRPRRLRWAAALLASGLLLTFFIDQPVHAWLRSHATSGQRQVMEWVSAAGDGQRLFLLALGLLVVGLWHQRVLLKVAGLGGMASVVVGGVVVQVLKRLVGRCRPYVFDQGACLAAVLGPSFAAGHDSFPSGHATAAFALAGVLARTYPQARLAWYAAAALVGVSRLFLDAHFPSDVLAGAALGIVAARLVLWHGLNQKPPSAAPV